MCSAYQEATLECKFDMEDDNLYSVKWYRNEAEFYRFVPNDRPKLQIFPQDGIRVEVSPYSGQEVELSDLLAAVQVLQGHSRPH